LRGQKRLQDDFAAFACGACDRIDNFDMHERLLWGDDVGLGVAVEPPTKLPIELLVGTALLGGSWVSVLTSSPLSIE
jgi:hypothetical protein